MICNSCNKEIIEQGFICDKCRLNNHSFSDDFTDKLYSDSDADYKKITDPIELNSKAKDLLKNYGDEDVIDYKKYVENMNKYSEHIRIAMHSSPQDILRRASNKYLEFDKNGNLIFVVYIYQEIPDYNLYNFDNYPKILISNLNIINFYKETILGYIDPIKKFFMLGNEGYIFHEESGLMILKSSIINGFELSGKKIRDGSFVSENQKSVAPIMIPFNEKNPPTFYHEHGSIISDENFFKINNDVILSSVSERLEKLNNFEENEKESKSTSFFLKSQEEYDQELYDRALININQSILFAPEDPNNYDLKSKILLKQEKFIEALHESNLSIRLESEKKPEFYSNRSKIRIKLKDFEGALMDIDIAVELYNDEFSWVYDDRATLKLMMGNYFDALKDIKMAISLQNDNYWFYLTKAEILEKISDPDQAVSDLGDVIYNKKLFNLDDMNLAYIYWQRGEISSRMKNYLSAIEDFNKALELSNGKYDFLESDIRDLRLLINKEIE
tara:strand:- start:2536 stop:4038 length:1503 start_codon:yes stop_codon:yes gene_type:complete